MGYIDFSYYVSSYGGTNVAEEQFQRYEIQSRMILDRCTFNRVRNAVKNVPDFEIPEDIKNAQCALIDYTKQVDDNGGKIIASETVSKHSVTYAGAKSYEEEVRGIVRKFLGGTPWTYAGMGAGYDPR